MKLNQELRNIEGGFTPKREKSFGIAPAMMGHIMKILSEMYSDPHKAIAREYIANAVDSHRMARKLGIVVPKAIEVSTPTKLLPVLKVRDYGIGMSEDEAEELLSNYGSSGDLKRQSDDIIGGFGIGSKAAFAVADSYTFRVWHGGRERVWLCTIKADAKRNIELLVDKASDEPAGVEVEVPVDISNAEKVVNGVNYVMEFLDEPIELNGALQEIPAIKSLDLLPGIKVLYGSEMSSSFSLDDEIIVGDFYYNLENLTSLIGYDETQKLRQLASLQNRAESRRAKDSDFDFSGSPTLSALMNRTCCLRLDGGMIRPAPSREALIFDKTAEKHIKAALRELEKRVEAEVSKMAESATSPIEVLRMVQRINSSELRHHTTTSLTFGKTPLTTVMLPHFALPFAGTTKVFLPYSRRKRRTGGYAARLRSVEEEVKSQLSFVSNQGEKERLNRLINTSTACDTGKFFTTKTYNIVEGEEMSVRQLSEATEAWWTKQVADMRAANPTANQYNDNAVFPLEHVVVVMGTADERKKFLADHAWALPGASLATLQKPPKMPKAPRVPGAAAAKKAAERNRGWSMAIGDGWDKCFRPAAGSRVINVEALGSEVARYFLDVREKFKKDVPDLATAELYLLTPLAKQLAEADAESKFEMVTLKTAVQEWVNTLASLDNDKRKGWCFDLAMALGSHYNRPVQVVPLNKAVDPWGLVECYEALQFFMYCGWYAKRAAAKGHLKTVLDFVSTRSGGPTAQLLSSVDEHFDLLNKLLREAHVKTLSKAAEAEVLKKLTPLLDALEGLFKERPELAALIKEGISEHKHPKLKSWKEALFDKVSD